MALPVTSGTASFLVSRDDIIKVALRHLKVIAIGETPQAEDVTNLALALNMILKMFNTQGWLRWVYQTINFPFVATQSVYTIAESGSPSFTNYRPVRIAHVWRRDSTIATAPVDTPLFELPRQGYDALTQKLQPGLPNQWMYDPQIGLSSITFWPVPTDGSQNAFVCIQRPIQDITSSTQNFDLEQEWFLPLGWILADEVVMDFEVDKDTQQLVSRRAEKWMKMAPDFSREEIGITYQPDLQQGGGGKFNV